MADNDQQDEITPGQRLLAGVSFLIFNALGVFGNLLVIVTLIRRRKEFTKFNFYVLVFMLAVADSLYVGANLIVQVPETFLGTKLRPLIFRRTVGIFHSLGFYGYFYTSVLIALDRFTAFLFPKCNAFLFERKPNVFFMAAIPFLLGFIGVPITTFGIECPKDFGELRWALACARNITAGTGRARGSWFALQGGVQRFLPLAVMLAYALVFVHLKWHQSHNSAAAQNNQLASAERSLLVQGGVIGTFLLATTQSFWLPAPRGFYGRLAVQWLAIINCSVNPIIYLVFNSLMRNNMREVVTCNTPTPVTSAHAHHKTAW